MRQARLLDTGNSASEGRRAIGVPNFTANLGIEWDIPHLPALMLHATLVHTGQTWVNDTHTAYAPAWTRTDLGVRWQAAIAERPLILRAMVENAFNRRILFWAASATGTGWLMQTQGLWPWQQPNHQTTTGEQRRVLLPDGSRLLLNTATAVNTNFNTHERRLTLLAGEIFLTTAHTLGHAADPRPLFVETDEGRIQALGTRFSVHRQSGRTLVRVMEHAVRIMPGQSAQTRTVQAGEQLAFSRTRMEAPHPARAADDAWIHGQLIVEDQPLGEFLNELSRYRRGVLRWDPAFASPASFPSMTQIASCGHSPRYCRYGSGS